MNRTIATCSHWMLSFFLVLIILLTACNSDSDSIIGTIHTKDTENQRMLVIPQLQEEDLDVDYKKLLTSGEYPEAFWVSKIASGAYEQGDKVEVLFEVSDDSFPAQVTAKRITKLK